MVSLCNPDPPVTIFVCADGGLSASLLPVRSFPYPSGVDSINYSFLHPFKGHVPFNLICLSPS